MWVTPDWTPFTGRGTMAGTPSLAQIPCSSLVLCFNAGGRPAGGVVHGKTCGPLGGREGLRFSGQGPRDSVKLA